MTSDVDGLTGAEHAEFLGSQWREEESEAEAMDEAFAQARTRAFEQLKANRCKATPHEMGLIAALALQHDVEPGIWHQLDTDLRTYPLYDALAMWLDHEAGLAVAVPAMMAAVVALFL